VAPKWFVVLGRRSVDKTTERGHGLDRTRIVRRRDVIRALLGGASFSVGARRQEAAAQDWIVQIIYDAAGRYGVSGDWLLNTAACESRLNPWAYNEVTGDCGLFQFRPATWAEWGADPALIWDVWNQADMAAWAFSVGLHTHWCCSGTWQGGEACM
jgi:hypothetical protein